MSARGFSLVELLVAMALAMAVTGAVEAMALPARAAFERVLGEADLSGGSRTALDLLIADVRQAGSGAAVSAAPSPLAAVLPVVVPLVDLDNAVVTTPARALRITAIEAGASQALLRDPVAAGSTLLRLDTAARCTATGPACGFEPGLRVVIFDSARAMTALVSGVLGGESVQITPATTAGFAAGAVVAAVKVATYGVRPDGDGSFRLVRVTAAGAEQPLLDAVVAFEVRVSGRAFAPVAAVAGTWPLYGPMPPQAGDDDPRDAWPPGENCTVARDADGLATSRLAALHASVDPWPIPSASLGDGPWCPDSVAAEPFDADLLRLRAVEIRLRVQAASAGSRGGSPRLFVRPGTAANPSRWVPDLERRVVIGLRNTP